MDQTEIIELIGKCSLRKLSRSVEECQYNLEFDTWQEDINVYFSRLTKALKCLDLSQEECSERYYVVASLLILYYECLAADNWRPTIFSNYPSKINEVFESQYHISLPFILQENKYFNKQKVFDTCLHILNESLGSNHNENKLKKHPVRTEAYCLLLKEIKHKGFEITPASVMPLTLLLIDDYVDEYKLKGLQCCSIVLENLYSLQLKHGNYYDVIYETLKRCLMNKNHDILAETMNCLVLLFMVLPLNAKAPIINDTLTVLNQMFLDPNLKLRKLLFNFTYKLIDIHCIHTAPWKMFLEIICENLDNCCVDGVRDILLDDVLKCLENWLKFCWCVWKLPANKKLLSVLIKLLYVIQEDEKKATKIQNILSTLCKLSTKEEQKLISDSLEKSIQDMKSVNEQFSVKLEELRNEVVN